MVSHWSSAERSLLIREITVAVWMSFMAIFLSYKMYRHRSKKSAGSGTKTYLTHSAQGFFLGMCFSYTFRVINRIATNERWDENYTDFSINWSWFYLLNWLAFNIGFMCMYLFILLRLYNTFRASARPVSKNVVFFHIFWMNVLEFMFCMYAVCDYAQLNPWDSVFGAGAAFVALAGVCHVEYVFHRKLFGWILYADLTATEQLSQKQLILLPIMVKHLILTTAVVVALVVYGFITAVWGFIALASADEAVLTALIEYNFTMVFLQVVMSFSVFMSFKANRKWYNCVCKCCDSRVNSGLALQTVRRIKSRQTQVRTRTLDEL